MHHLRLFCLPGVSTNPSFPHVTLKEEGEDPLERICHLSCAILG